MQIVPPKRRIARVKDFDTGDIIAIDSPDFVEGKVDKKYFMLVSNGAFGENTGDGRRKAVDLKTGILMSLDLNEKAELYENVVLYLNAETKEATK